MWIRCFYCSAWQQILREDSTDTTEGYCSRHGMNQRSYEACHDGDPKKAESSIVSG